MLNSLCHSPAHDSSSFRGDTVCKRCSSPDLFIKQQGAHLGLFCRQCQLWQRWIRKSDARHYQSQKVDTPSKTAIIADLPDEPTDLAAEIDDLRKVIVGHDRQLAVLTKAILDCGWLKGRKVPAVVDIDDELVNRLAREVAQVAR